MRGSAGSPFEEVDYEGIKQFIIKEHPVLDKAVRSLVEKKEDAVQAEDFVKTYLRHSKVDLSVLQLIDLYIAV